MYCNNCGKENDTDNLFCEFCGSKLKTADNTRILSDNQENKKLNLCDKKSLITGGIIATVVLIVAICCLILYHSSKTTSEYNEKINMADGYMKAMEYEKAEAGYLEAIDIEPKKEEAYIKAAEVYVVQQKYDKAVEILEIGSSNSGKPVIDKKLKQVRSYSIYERYLEETLIPKYGTVKTNEQLNRYALSDGLVSAVVKDFNKDEIPDMLTVKYGEGYNTEITLTLYTCIDNGIEELAKEIEQFNDLDDSACKYNIFLKTYKGHTYIVIGWESIISYGCTKGIYIYEVDDSVHQQSTLLYNCYESNCEYIVNGVTAVQYSGDEEYSIPDESVNNKGIEVFESALEPYGIKKERITYPHEYSWIKIKNLDYDINEETEQNICCIQHGIYINDTQVDLAAGEMRYISDYSGLIK